jgi:hypothetical protein
MRNDAQAVQDEVQARAARRRRNMALLRALRVI